MRLVPYIAEAARRRVRTYLRLVSRHQALNSSGATASNGEAVAAWSNAFGNMERAVNVATGNPVYSSAEPYVTFSGSARGMNAHLARYVTAVPVPDASGQDVVPGKGFTNTGLYRNEDGTWWMGNDGRARGSASFFPSLVRVSADLTTKLQEILLKPLFPSIGSVQGVVVANDGTLWFASTDENLVRNVSTAGVSLGSIAITSPNGLAYDKTNNRLIVQFPSNVRTYNPATGAEVATLPFTAGIDHMQWLSNGDIIATIGNNGSTGEAYILRNGATGWRQWTPLTNALAIEGIWYDETESRLYISSDEYFHNDATSVNKTNIYDLPPRYVSGFEVHARFKLPASRSKTECIMSIGEPVANPGFGMFALSTGNTTLRLFTNTAIGTSNRVQLNVTVSDMSVESLIRVQVNLTTKLLGIWQNGTLISSSLSLAACGSEMLMSLAGIGHNPQDSSQNCAVSMKELRITPILTTIEAAQVASEMAS